MFGRRRAVFALLSSGWRFWLPAACLALGAVVATQDLDTWLEGRIPYLWYLLVSRTLGLALLVIPIFLYLVWRRTAQGERAAHEQLDAAVQLREDLTNMLVHDLKAPLASAGMALNILKRGQAADRRDPSEEEALVELASSSCRRLQGMVQDMLDVARAQAGRVPLDLASADLLSVVRQAVEEAGPGAEERSVQLKEHHAPAPLRVLMDAHRVRRVVSDLLENAIKLSPHGGDIEISADVVGTDARVAVRDSGEGIPVDLRTRFSEKFGQAEAGQRARRRSVGLGLTFCKLTVEAHGGRIWIESAPVQGSVFYFTLPQGGVPGPDC